MFKVIGSVVVYGFALFGLAKWTAQPFVDTRRP